VTTVGGHHRYQDDWEAPDTQTIGLEFANKSLITWEGRSCNGQTTDGSTVGVAFYGENGTIQIEGGNAYKILDLKGKVIKEVKNDVTVDARNVTSPSQALDAIHIQNFFDGIKSGTELASDIESGHISTLLVQLGNIAQRSGGMLEIDPSNGHILNNREAKELWRREYERGWEPTI